MRPWRFDQVLPEDPHLHCFPSSLRMFSALRRMLGSALLCLLTSVVAAAPGERAPSVALHYSNKAPLDDLKLFDVVVVEPDHGYDPAAFRVHGGDLYAYASVAEVQPSRPYFKDVPAAWQLARNGQWNSIVIDQTPAEWPAFFADRVIGPLWKQGYRGFFLDTLDSYRLASQFDEAAQQDGLVRVVQTLHQRYPGIKLILNRGFEVIPRLKGQVAMVAAESLYRGWNASTRRYEPVAEASRTWLLGQLTTIRERDGIPVLAIDYVAPHDRTLARETAQRIRGHGFAAWVTDSDLSTVGIGNVELVPRRVLIVYNSADSPALNYSAAHRFFQMPLNHMGYVVDYADIQKPLPQDIYRDRYAGVVTSFPGFVPSAHQRELSRWLHRQMAVGMPVAILGDFGLLPDRSWVENAGIRAQGLDPQGALRMTRSDPMLAFEAPLPVVGKDFVPVQLAGKLAAQATPLVEFRDQKNQTFVGGALMPWGGFLNDPFVLTDIPGSDQSRWVVDPFAFLARALQLQPLPIPDITTENGRRLLLAHVDGDGFPSLAEFPGSPTAAEVMLKEVLEKYRIPQTVAVIEGETAPHGLYPQMSAKLEDIARRMYRLPHVEIASHSFSHPYLWNTKVKHGLFAENPEADYHMNIPGYTMDLNREIVGSVEYIRQRLAPPRKPVEVFQWSGDTAPDGEALRIAHEAGLVNINGGDTFISKLNPTITAIRAHGITKDGYLQVYAPIANENIYTNLWRGPFYGYERVLETFEMTDTPRRIKPVGIYYHTYSASKQASLRALRKVYDWALAQPLHPVFTSEYIRKVQDFHTLAVGRDGAAWHVRSNGHLRTLRLPPTAGKAVFEGSQGVAGSSEGIEGSYLHLTGNRAVFGLQAAGPAGAAAGAKQPVLLHDANARIARWAAGPADRSVEFELQGHVPLQWSLAGMDETCQVRAGNRVVAPQKSPALARADVRFYRLTDASAHIQVTCAAR